MPKRFIFVLVITQALLTAFHLLFYYVLLLFFPTLAAYHKTVFTAILLLSVSFLVFSVLCHYFENFIFRLGYILAGIWLVLGFYCATALTLALILSQVFNSGLEPLGYIAEGVGMALTLYGLLNARFHRITKIKVKLANLPEAWKNKTAIVAADLHFGQVLRTKTAKNIVKLINAQTPDIVFIPGDFYDGVHNNLHHTADVFKNIKAPLGIYFCSGNHELYAGYGACEQAIKDAGIKILEDTKVEIQGLQIFGLAYKSETDEEVEERLKNIGVDASKPSLLLKHVPDHLPAIEKAGINFQISGHTHHGQIWPFRYITSKVFKGFDYGLKRLGNLQVYTSSGVGTWGPPLRVFTKSELVKISFE